MPKFLQEDLKLFAGIVSDLFPTIKEEETDYGILDHAIRKACEKSNLKDVEGELWPQDFYRPMGFQSEEVLAPATLESRAGDRDRAMLSPGSLATDQGAPGLVLTSALQVMGSMFLYQDPPVKVFCPW